MTIKKTIKKAVKKVVKAPLNLIKKQWDKNQAFRNKNATYEQYKQNWK